MTRRLLIALLCSLGCCPGRGQAVFVPPGASVFAYERDTVSVFGDLLNNGSFGSAAGATVNFFGSRWVNAGQALLPGSPGGMFRFLGKGRQSLAGGYRFNEGLGASFPNLSIENAAGVWLEDLQDLRIRGNLHFGKGYLYLQGWNALADSLVTGYSAEGFVVTGPGLSGGYLYRRRGDSAGLVFPLGTAPGSYTPMALKDTAAGLRGATVFDQLYPRSQSGQPVENFVQKTWHLKGAAGAGADTLYLQYGSGDQGSGFAALIDSSYITRYDVTRQVWDTAPPRGLRTPATLTTGAPSPESYQNERLFPEGLDSLNWFSVTSAAMGPVACPFADFRLWVAQRYSYRWVQLFWRTNRERNVDHYELERRRDTAQDFTTIATVPSQAVGGSSDRLLYYYYADDNMYDGWTSYRLKLVSPGGCVAYTAVQEVPWGIGTQVWPNPSPGEVHVRVRGVNHPVALQVVNTLGQVLYRYTVDGEITLHLGQLPDAAYFLVFRDPRMNERLVATVKLIIRHP